MKKLALFIALTSAYFTASAQTWQQVGNTLQRQTNGIYSNFRFNMGSPGNVYFYSKPQVDSIIINGATYTAGYGLGLSAFQFRLDSTIAVNKTFFNSVIGTATLNRINARIPYIGATTDVDLGSHNITTTGSGLFNNYVQSRNFNIYSSSTGGTASITYGPGGITGFKAQYLQDKNGTFAYLDDITSALTGYVPVTRAINTTNGILGGGNLGSDLNLQVDSTKYQTVANLFPKGDTRWLTYVLNPTTTFPVNDRSGYIPVSSLDVNTGGINRDLNIITAGSGQVNFMGGKIGFLPSLFNGPDYGPNIGGIAYRPPTETMTKNFFLFRGGQYVFENDSATWYLSLTPTGISTAPYRPGKTPHSGLEVYTSLSVGRTYAGTYTAPDNGAMIQGQLAIGDTLTHNNKVFIRGNTEVTGGLKVDSGLVVTSSNKKGLTVKDSVLNYIIQIRPNTNGGSIYTYNNSTSSYLPTMLASDAATNSTTRAGQVYIGRNFDDGSNSTLQVSGNGSYSGTVEIDSIAANSILKTNGNKHIVAAAPGDFGTVTNVSSANGDISVANQTTTPVLTLNSGNSANQIVKRATGGAIDLPVNAALTSNSGRIVLNNGSVYLGDIDGINPATPVRLMQNGAEFLRHLGTVGNYTGSFNISGSLGVNIIPTGVVGTNNILVNNSGVINQIAANSYLTSSSAASTYVPYTGASTDVTLGTHNITAANGTIGRFGTAGGGLQIVSTADVNKAGNITSIAKSSTTQNFTLPDASGYAVVETDTADVVSQTSTYGRVSPAMKAGMYQVNAVLDINSITTDVLKVTISWTDHGGNARSSDLFNQGATSPNMSTADSSHYPPLSIYCQQGSTITYSVVSVSGGGTHNFNFYARAVHL